MRFKKYINEFTDQIIWFSGEGSSFQDAVKIFGVTSTVQGIEMEKRFIGQQYSDWHFCLQELVIKNNRAYDVITIRLPDYSLRKVYFDITEFYGK